MSLDRESHKRMVGSQDPGREMGAWGRGCKIKQSMETTNKNISKVDPYEVLDLWILNGISFNAL